MMLYQGKPSERCVTFIPYSYVKSKFLLEQKQNYFIIDHGLWFNSLDIIFVDLKSTYFHTP